MSATRRCWLVALAVMWVVSLIGGPTLLAAEKKAAEKKAADNDLDLLRDLLGGEEKPPPEPPKKEKRGELRAVRAAKKEAPKKRGGLDELDDLLGVPGVEEPAKKATGPAGPGLDVPGDVAVEAPDKKDGAEGTKATIRPRPSRRERIRTWSQDLKKEDGLGRGQARAAWRRGPAGTQAEIVDLKNTLQRGRNPLVVVSAVWALADLAPRARRLGAGEVASAVAALIGAVSHTDSWVRQEAIWQVSRLGARDLPAEVTRMVRDQGVAALVSALEDDKWFVREYAVRALGRLVDPGQSAETVVAAAQGRAADVLARKDDPDPRVRARLEAVAARFHVQ